MFSKVVNEQGSNRSTTATTLLTKMTEEANEFCKMLNEQVATACPSRGAQIYQALQITKHALGEEFQGKRKNNDSASCRARSLARSLARALFLSLLVFQSFSLFFSKRARASSLSLS
jgi:hypothetical protein